MQIRTQLNDNCPRSARENVVQKVSETTHARENEICLDVSHENVYIQVSSYRRDLHRKHYKWSLCSIDKFKSNCSFLIKYLLVNSFLSRLWENFHRSTEQKSQRENAIHCYSVQAIDLDENIQWCWMEPSHKSLMIDKNFILLLMHFTASHRQQQSSRSTNFYIKLYKVLLNFFYDYFNNIRTNCHHHHPHKIYLHPQSSINTFCDLSTNSKSRNILFVIDELSGIEHHRPHVVRSSLHVKLRTLNFLYGILLIQRHVMCNNSYEFSDNHHNVKQHILLQLLAHNQMILYVTTTWNYHRLHHHHHPMQFQMPDDKSCHEIENAISTLATTSNHKLKTTTPNDNDTCHQENEKFSNCYQQFHRTFRSNDSVKSHLNAILFLIILCIPLLTAASSVHNLKYSTNVVKTKYGPLRGIILRSTPTVEGYLGVPYGKSQLHISPICCHSLFIFLPSPISTSSVFANAFEIIKKWRVKSFSILMRVATAACVLR